MVGFTHQRFLVVVTRIAHKVIADLVLTFFFGICSLTKLHLMVERRFNPYHMRSLENQQQSIIFILSISFNYYNLRIYTIHLTIAVEVDILVPKNKI